MKKAQAAIQLLRRSRGIRAARVDPPDGRGEPGGLNRAPALDQALGVAPASVGSLGSKTISP